MATQPKQLTTVEEYLRQERTALDRHEYLNGEVFAVAGGTRTHSIISTNLLVNPLVIFEVLSDSTESYDRGKKFELYRQIPSFREYLIAAQDRPYVEHHAREHARGKAWIMREYTSREEVITLEAIPVKLRLTDLYAKVAFPAEAR